MPAAKAATEEGAGVLCRVEWKRWRWGCEVGIGAVEEGVSIGSGGGRGGGMWWWWW